MKMGKTNFVALIAVGLLIAACGGGDEQQNPAPAPSGGGNSTPTVGSCSIPPGTALPSTPYTGNMWSYQNAYGTTNSLKLYATYQSAVPSTPNTGNPYPMIYPQQQNYPILAAGEITISLSEFYPQIRYYGMQDQVVRTCVSSQDLSSGIQSPGFFSPIDGSVQRLTVRGTITVPASLSGTTVPQGPYYYQQSMPTSATKIIEATLGGSGPTRFIFGPMVANQSGRINGSVEVRLLNPPSQNYYGQQAPSQPVQFSAQ